MSNKVRAYFTCSRLSVWQAAHWGWSSGLSPGLPVPLALWAKTHRDRDTTWASQAFNSSHIHLVWSPLIRSPTWPYESGTRSHSCRCRRWPRRTWCCFPTHDVERVSATSKELGKSGVKLIVNRIITELTWASCSASLKDTSLSSSMSILFPTRRMGTPSPAASWKTTGKSLIGTTAKDTKLSRGQCLSGRLLSPDSTHWANQRSLLWVGPGHWWATASRPWSSPPRWRRTSAPRRPPCERTAWWCCGTCGDECGKSMILSFYRHEFCTEL